MRSYRLTLGALFSEGARLTWLEMQARGLSQADLRRKLNTRGGELPRFLYGERAATLWFAAGVETELGVPAAAWTREPTQPFEPPALVVATAEVKRAGKRATRRLLAAPSPRPEAA